ncbi:creatininase family protein [Chelativorans sp. AA-79]|uniref:creatininase family protein n=1 Tax=Chelativorans sp. AA-79 TaxID=3028735 RepID=UPI0023F75592|nr:creatininase family protein [Chelativorans sp. AA-79]WEX09648.1 creatininase family protein [Chelativorans sp. AA-79]
MQLKSHWWWDHTTKDFAELDMSKVVAVLPVAAVEQHGPHLPVKVDAAINAGVLTRTVELMPADMPVLVLPMQAVGKSVEHIAYPGTLTLSYETLARVWYEIAESVYRAGCRKIVFINSHGGQPQVMEIICRELRVKLGMFAVSAWAYSGADISDLFSAHERKHGIHGGEMETSLMLHLHRDLIDMEYARDFVPVSVEMEKKGGLLMPEGALVGYGWQTQDVQPWGACGNASAADADRGRIVVERCAEGLVRLFQEVLDFPLDGMTRKTAFGGA